MKKILVSLLAVMAVAGSFTAAAAKPKKPPPAPAVVEIPVLTTLVYGVGNFAVATGRFAVDVVSAPFELIPKPAPAPLPKKAKKTASK